jgi:hypothetical protein
MEATCNPPNELPQLIPIAPQNARDYQARSVIARKANKIAAILEETQEMRDEKERDLLRAANAQLTDDLRARVIRQLDDLDRQWKKRPSERTSIAQAQATLWKLLFPQPKASRSRRDLSDQGQA